jgi:hypothetical protein
MAVITPAKRAALEPAIAKLTQASKLKSEAEAEITRIVCSWLEVDAATQPVEVNLDAGTYNVLEVPDLPPGVEPEDLAQ